MHNFVEQELGSEARLHLQRMRRGGRSNEKGNRLEDRYATYKIIESFQAVYSSEPQLELAHQEEGFVDDLVIKYPSLSLKINYQAKDKQQLTWADFEQNFAYQYIIDIKYHGYDQSKTIALIAPKDQHDKLNQDIPHNIAKHTACEHFPNDESISSLILTYLPLRNALKEVVRKKDDYSHLEAAFAHVLGQWKVNQTGLVRDILDNVIAYATPKLFIKQPHIPDLVVSNELILILDAAQNLSYDLSNEALALNINGFKYEISVYDNDYQRKLQMLVEKRPKTALDFIQLWEGMK